MTLAVAATTITDQQYAVEVDTALAAFWDAESALNLPLVQSINEVFRTAGIDTIGTKRRYSNPKPQGTLSQALQVVEGLATCPREDRLWDASSAREDLRNYIAARAKMDEVKAAQEPFNAEYAEVRWTRAFLVLNTGGHVHSSRACSTCFATTQYGWLPQVSGMDEAQVVEYAGSDACTICYPSAPVEALSRFRSVFHASEVEAQQAREARAAAKAERDAKKAEKTLSPPVKIFEGTYTNHRTGLLYDRYETLETVHSAKTWLTDSQEAWRRSQPSDTDVQTVAQALATKFGTTPEAEIAAAAERAAKRK